MGACNFIEFKSGMTAREAFNALVAESEWEYGHDPYNGTISTTRLIEQPHWQVASEWSDDAREAAFKVAVDDGWGKKRESRYIDCGRCGDGLRMWAFYGLASC